MEDYDLTEAGARLLVTIEQLIENLEYVVISVVVLGQAKQNRNEDTALYHGYIQHTIQMISERIVLFDLKEFVAWDSV